MRWRPNWPPTREPEEAETDEQVGEDREIEPASAHTAFEGFSPWRASASSAGVVDDEESPQKETDPSNQFMPSSKDLMGRVWAEDFLHSDKSPDETIIEPQDALSPLTHSAQYVTNVREEAIPSVATPAAENNSPAEPVEVAEPSGIDPVQPEPNPSSGVSDWRSAFTKAPEEAVQIVESPSLSMSPWRMSTPPVQSTRRGDFAEAANISDQLTAPEVQSPVGHRY